MLWKWKTLQTVTLLGKTYDVLAMSTKFADSLGTAGGAPFWGKGASDNGSFTVDYRDTSDKFWSILANRRPIAIMSFSRWAINKEWMLDAWATNWKNIAWETVLDYTNRQGLPDDETWDPPYIGGSTQDPAPPSQGNPPQPGGGNPPDSTQPGSNAVIPPDVPAMNTRRFTNLSDVRIKTSLNNAFATNQLQAKINDVIGPGDFVSNFLAYHVVWYREWWASQHPPADQACLFSGHTHVGGQISVADAERAVQIQLEELYRDLPFT